MKYGNAEDESGYDSSGGFIRPTINPTGDFKTITKPSISNFSISTSYHITAKGFMAAVRICRSKFDQLVSENKIRIIRKRRKIYVPTSEVDRYFSDPSIK